MDEQFKFAHGVDRANEMICVKMLWYKVDKSESSYDELQLFATKKEDKNLQEIVYVKYKTWIFHRSTWCNDISILESFYN